MATIERFEDIKAWQDARKFCQWVHKVVQTTGLKNDFKLRGQIEDSSGSIMDNIAEGFERSGRKEFINFLSYSKGSAGESRSQLYRLLDKDYISKEEHKEQYEFLVALSKRLGSFIKYLKGSDYKGWKFEEPKEPYGNIDDFNLEL